MHEEKQKLHTLLRYQRGASGIKILDLLNKLTHNRTKMEENRKINEQTANDRSSTKKNLKNNTTAHVKCNTKIELFPAGPDKQVCIEKVQN